MNFLSTVKYYLLTLFVILAGTTLFLVWVTLPVGGNTAPVMVSVPKGSNAAGVAALLKDKGLIKNSKAFTIAVDLAGKSTSIMPGAYKLDRQMSLWKIVDIIGRKEISAVWVTIPEGYTMQEIAARLAEKDLVSEEEFLKAAGKGAKYSGVSAGANGSLEGFLFPDTYLVSLPADADSIVGEMVRTFERKIIMPCKSEIDSSELSRLVPGNDNLRSVIILASLIEREAKAPKERAMISGVIYNRLRAGMKLEIDATVQYARGEHKSRLFYRDLEINSPYNTYLHAGLPPGPIGNPGVASVEAALRPARIDALFYVARKDGTHIFTRTLAEHNAAKRKIRSSS